MKYNHLGYNRGEIKEILIPSSDHFRDSLHLNYSKSTAIESSEIFSEKIHFQVEAGKALLEKTEFQDSLKMEATPVIALDGETIWNDKLLFSCDTGKEISEHEEFGEKIKISADIGKEMKEEVVFSDRMLARTELSKLIHSKDNFVDNLMMLSSAKTHHEEVTILNIDLEPNGVLEMDSEFFTVDYNGVNVFDKHSGEWVILSRNLAEIEISATGQDLSIEMIYRERYL